MASWLLCVIYPVDIMIEAITVYGRFLHIFSLYMLLTVARQARPSHLSRDICMEEDHWAAECPRVSWLHD
jgi:hypothetical protein